MVSQFCLGCKCDEQGETLIMREVKMRLSKSPSHSLSCRCVNLCESVNFPHIVFLFLAVTYDYKFNEPLSWKWGKMEINTHK